MGAYYIPKLIFSHDFPVKVGDAYYIRMRIVFEFFMVAISLYNINFNNKLSAINGDGDDEDDDDDDDDVVGWADG